MYHKVITVRNRNYCFT